MKKFYLVSSLSVLSLSAISAAKVNKQQGARIAKQTQSADQACQALDLASGLSFNFCVSGKGASKGLTREERAQVDLLVTSLTKRFARAKTKAMSVTPYNYEVFQVPNLSFDDAPAPCSGEYGENCDLIPSNWNSDSAVNSSGSESIFWGTNNDEFPGRADSIDFNHFE